MRKRKSKLRLVDAVDLGTEQTRARLKQCPVDHMAQTWGRNFRDINEIERAAREVRRIYLMIAGGLMPKAIDLNNQVKSSNTPLPEWLAMRRRDIYIPWAKEIDWRYGIVISWLIDEVPLVMLDKRLSKRKGTCRDLLTHCLTRYATISGNLKNTPTIC